MSPLWHVTPLFNKRSSSRSGKQHSLCFLSPLVLLHWLSTVKEILRKPNCYLQIPEKVKNGKVTSVKNIYSLDHRLWHITGYQFNFSLPSLILSLSFCVTQCWRPCLRELALTRVSAFFYAGEVSCRFSETESRKGNTEEYSCKNAQWYWSGFSCGWASVQLL